MRASQELAAAGAAEQQSSSSGGSGRTAAEAHHAGPGLGWRASADCQRFSRECTGRAGPGIRASNPHRLRYHATTRRRHQPGGRNVPLANTAHKSHRETVGTESQVSGPWVGLTGRRARDRVNQQQNSSSIKAVDQQWDQQRILQSAGPEPWRGPRTNHSKRLGKPDHPEVGPQEIRIHLKHEHLPAQGPETWKVNR
jgi:hypothetical protein